jgi:hypothetical protein
MPKLNNGLMIKAICTLLVLLLIGFNSWIGASIIELKEQVGRMEVKIDMCIKRLERLE